MSSFALPTVAASIIGPLFSFSLSLPRYLSVQEDERKTIKKPYNIIHGWRLLGAKQYLYRFSMASIDSWPCN